MALKDRLSAAFNALFQRAASIDVLPAAVLGRPLSLPAENLDYTFAFKLIPDIYSCVTLIQTSLAGLPLRFYRLNSEGEREEILPDEIGSPAELWKRANDLETGYDLTEQLVGGLKLHGNGYLFLERLTANTGAPVRELFVLPADRVAPIPGPKRTRAGYEFDLGQGKKLRIPPQNIVHIKNYDPDGMGLGLSDLSALALSYTTKRDASRWLAKFYTTGAAVSGHYAVPGVLPPAELERIKSELLKRSKGPDQAFHPVILGAGLEFVRAGLTHHEMQFMETAHLTSADIFRAFKVPPVLLGVKEGGGLSDAGATTDLLLFYEQCISPIAKRIERSLGEFFLPLFGQGIECEYDMTNVRAFQDTFLKQAQALAIATGAPCVTRNEARRRLGLPPVDDPAADELLVPFNLTTIAQAAKQANEPESDPFADPSDDPKPAPEDEEQTAARARNARRARNDRDLSRFEREFAEGVRRMFLQQEERVVVNLRAAAGERLATRSYDPRSLLTDDEMDRRLLHALYQAVIGGRGQEALDEVALNLVFQAFNERTDKWIRSKSMSTLTHINDTTRKRLAESLGKGILNNEGIAELTARVREIYLDRRAGQTLMIARTETAGAFNYASMAAWDQSGVIAEKEWLTAQDDLVRDAHADIDGDIVQLDQPFTMQADDGTVHKAMFPGDPSLPFELAVNCRCTIAPVTQDTKAPRSLRWTNGDGHVPRLEEIFR